MNMQNFRGSVEKALAKAGRAFSMRNFRKYQKHILAVLAAALIVVWLIGYTGGARGRREGGAEQHVGEILGEKIRADAFRVQRSLLRIVDPTLRDVEDQALIDQHVWQTMILKRLAASENIRASDGEVRKYLESAFKDKEGRFNYDAYRHTLDRSRLSEEQYENVVRDLIVASRYLSTLGESVRATAPEVREVFLQSLDEAEINFVTVPAAEFKADAFPGEDALRAFYDKQVAQDRYKEPEKLVARYVLVPYADFENKVEVKEDQIALYYEQKKDTTYKEEDGTYRPLDKVRAEIERALREKGARTLADEKLYKLDENLSSQRSGEWDKIAAEHGLKVQTTPPFSRDAGEVIAGAKDFVSTAYETRDKAKRKEIDSESIWLGESSRGPFLFEIAKEVPPAAIRLQDIRLKVQADYVREESGALAAKFAAELRQQIIAKQFEKATAEAALRKPWLAPRTALVKRPRETELGYVGTVPGLKGNQFLLASEVFGLGEGEVSLPVRDGEDPYTYHIAVVRSFKSYTPDEAFEKRAAEGKETEVEYAVFKAADYAASVKVGKGEAASYYDSHREDFAEPEKVRIQYLAVDYSRDIPPAGEGEQADSLKQQKAREVMDKVRGELSKGKKRLIEIAEALNLTAAEIGPLSYADLSEVIVKRNWPESVLETIKQLKPGEISPGVEYADGILVFGLDEVRPARVRPLEGVEAEINRRILAERSAAAARKAAEEFHTLAAKKSFKEAVEKTKGLKAETAHFVGTIAEEKELDPLALGCASLKEGDLIKPVSGEDGAAWFAGLIKKKFPYTRQYFEEDIALFGQFHLRRQRWRALVRWTRRLLEDNPLNLPEAQGPPGEERSGRELPPAPVDLGD